MSGMPDSSPSSGSKKAKGMKNEDGREKGAAYNKQEKAKADFKEVGVNPNQDVKKINGGKDHPGVEEGGY